MWRRLMEYLGLTDSDEQRAYAYFDWIEEGVKNGWITRPDCMYHGAKDPIPWTQEEAEWSDDPCIVAARFWGTEEIPLYLGERL